MTTIILICFAVLLLLNTNWMVGISLLLGGTMFFLVNLIFRQESMLYVPCVMPGMQKPSDNPVGMRSPAERGLSYEDVYLKTADGVRLHAWFILAREESVQAPTILFFHANAGNIGLRVPNFDGIVEKLRANIFALDYRGYGKSGGEPSEQGLIEDALSAWRWLREAASAGRIDGERLFVFGRSLGGAVAVALSSVLQQKGEAPPRGLMLENTFLSVSAVVDAWFPIIAFESIKARFLRLRWDTLERIRCLEVPILFLCGAKDEMIPTWHSEVLLSSAEKASLKRRIVFPAGGHNDTWETGGARYWDEQASFLAECGSKKE